jgi:hypothetical protein
MFSRDVFAAPNEDLAEISDAFRRTHYHGIRPHRRLLPTGRPRGLPAYALGFRGAAINIPTAMRRRVVPKTGSYFLRRM